MTKEPLIRHVLSILAGTWGDEPDDSVNTVFCLRVADFDYARLTNVQPRTRRKVSQADVNQKLLKDDDILIEKSGGGDKTPVGRAIIVAGINNPTTYANFIERVRLKPTLNPRYANYALSHLYSRKINTKYIKQNTGIQNLDVKAYLNEPIAIPDMNKQEDAVNYLDSKTQTLDKMLIAKNQTYIHLSELRQAIIDRTILEAGMSDLLPLKRIAMMINRGASPSYADNGKAKFINQACIYSDGIKFSAVKAADELAHTTDGRGYLHKGDLLVNSTGTGTLGRVAVFDQDNNGTYFADSHVTIVRPNLKKVDPEYLRYVMLSTKFQDEVYTLCVSGSTNQIELSRERFREIYIPVPSLEVQSDIVSMLNRKIKSVDNANKVLQKSIGQLEEYRSSLISNVVGGKVEV